MPDPKTPNFNNPLLLKDITDIINSNPFAKTYIAGQNKKITMANCYDMAANFLNGYKQPNVANKALDDMTALLVNYRTMKASLDLAMQNAKEGNHNGYIENAEKAKVQFISLMGANPSFSKRINNFVSVVTKKGVSLGDDNLRMLLSIAQNVDDIADRCNMQLDKEKLISCSDKANSERKLNNELTDKIYEYIGACFKNNILGTDLDDAAATWSKRKNDHLKEIEDNKIKQVQHTKNYNEYCNRIKENNEKIEELDKQASAESDRKILFSKLQKELKDMSSGVVQNLKAVTNIENEIKDYQYNLKQVNENIAIGEQKIAQYQKSRDFIDNISPDQKESIAKAQQLSLQYKIVRTGYDRLRQFNFDVSDSYRNSLAKGGDMSEVSKENQQKIAIYNEIKGKMIAADPSLKGKFDAFEMNTTNKIPADFSKCMAEDIFKSNKARAQVFNGIQNTRYYQQYMNAVKDVDMLGASQNALESLNKEKAALETNIIEANDRLKDAQKKVAGWADRFKAALGNNFPKKATVGNIGKALRVESTAANDNLEKINKEKALAKKSIEEYTQKIASLGEDLSEIKNNVLIGKVNNCNEHLDLVAEYKEDREKMLQSMESLADNAREISSNSKEAMLNPVNRLKKRLTDIRDTFDNVTSFWSKGRSPECKKMMDGISNLITVLDNKDAKLSDITAEVNKVKGATQGYLDAKHGQNILKIFTSEQRHWRLSKAEEALSALESAGKMFNDLSKDPHIENINKFIDESKSLMNKGPAEELQNRIVERHEQVIGKRMGLQKNETKEHANIMQSI